MPATTYNQTEGRYRFGEKRDRDEERPVFNRLFVLCGKEHTADDLRRVFEECGTLDDIFVVKDKKTGENRGIAYIQYSKMSEACLAIDTLNGKKLSEEDTGPKLKVIMAQPRSGSPQSNLDLEDETALTRLFVILPKGMEEEKVRESFSQFGDIEDIAVVKDRNTGEKKGFGYVKYYKAYDAAKALEGADRNFKAVMAEPKSSRRKREMSGSDGGKIMTPTRDYGFSGGRGGDISNSMQPQSIASLGFEGAGAIGNRLQVNCALNVTGDQLARLFDVIPGMELCDLKRNFSTGESKGVAIVVYNSVGSATYAKEKLNGFEYPPGFKLSVRYAPDGQEGGFVNNGSDSMGLNFGALAIPSPVGGNSICNVDLPPPKPVVKTEEVAERLFIVCQPPPPPPNVLVDVFSRFGDLIDVFTLRNKNFGYAKFASTEGAEKAMQALHGAEICGSKIKVLTAEPPKKMQKVQQDDEDEEDQQV